MTSDILKGSMSHIGMLCPPATSHLNAFAALGRRLQSRGHRVTAFQTPEMEAAVLSHGIEFRPVAEKSFPSGTLAETYRTLGTLSGFALLRFTRDYFVKYTTAVMLEGLESFREARIDALLVDQTLAGGESIARMLDVPFATVAVGLDLYAEADIPPFFSTLSYTGNPVRRLVHIPLYIVWGVLARPVDAAIKEIRRKWNLPAYSSKGELTSTRAHITQQPAFFDFPRKTVPEYFHYTGPFHDLRTRPAVPFPWDQLDSSRPLIYASMGSLQNQNTWVFRTIAEACQGLKAQLVLSLGGGCHPDELGPLPGTPLVVRYAPQLELLRRAQLVITHAGLNTALETLTAGVPMVAIPVGNDQPGTAARIRYIGAGEFVSVNRLTAPRLRRAVTRVLSDEKYRSACSRWQAEIQRVNGLEKAATILEQALGLIPSERTPASAAQDNAGLSQAGQ